MSEESSTRVLLERWCTGDKEALHVLLERTLPWLRKHVQRRLGRLLRAKGQTTDFVQEAAIDLLNYGPRFVLSDERQFRALVARVVENVLRDQNDWFRAKRRAIDRERPLPPNSVLDLDVGPNSEERPSQIAQRREEEAWARLGIRLLSPMDQQVIYLRQWTGATFGAIGEEMGLQEDAARMRFQRAVTKLAEKVLLLKTGRIRAATEGDLPEAPT